MKSKLSKRLFGLFIASLTSSPAAALAGANTYADVHLQLQLPDGYTQLGNIGANAIDDATGQLVMMGIPNLTTGEIDFYKLNTPVMERGGNLPSDYDLSQNYPNPFNPMTNMQYDLPKPGHVTIDIFNSKGEHVKTLVDRNVGAGMQTVSWDGTDDFGRGVSAGLYLARMSAGDYNEVIKMIKTDGTVASGRGGGFITGLAKPAGVNDNGVVYRFNVYGDNIEPNSLVQRIVNDTSMVVPVQGKIDVNPLSLSFNEADSSQIDLSQKVNAAFGVSSYRVDNPNGNLIVDVNGDYLKVKGSDGDVNGNFPFDLIVRDNHGTEKRIQFPTTINPMSDLRNFKLIDVFDMRGVSQAPTTVTLYNGSKTYTFTTPDSLLNAQVEPGTYNVTVSNDSMHLPFIIKTSDGQIARSIPRLPETQLDLSKDLEGRIYQVSKRFDTAPYGEIWDRTGKGPNGVELWRPPADGSDPTGTTTLQRTVSPVDTVAIGPRIKNYYVYLGEDAEHQLQAPFDGLRPNLRQMSDEVKQKIIEYLTSTEMDSFRNAGLEGDDKYQVNVYFGRDPPLRLVQEGSNNFARGRVGWHIVMPSNSNLHSEEVGQNVNRTYSAMSFINVNEPLLIDGELNPNYKAELTQGDGPRSDDNNPNSPSFFKQPVTFKVLQPYDNTSQRASNIFREGFGFKE